jgi:hypothetical protein
MLRVRIRCAMTRKRPRADTGGGCRGRSYDPRSTTRGPACLTSVCIQGDLKAIIYGQARRAFEDPFVGYKGV